MATKVMAIMSPRITAHRLANTESSTFTIRINRGLASFPTSLPSLRERVGPVEAGPANAAGSQLVL